MSADDHRERIAATVSRDLPDDPPEGFRPMETRDGFNLMMGRIYGRKGKDGMLVFGFRCSPRHMNNHGACHGGMLASFADFCAYAVRIAADLPVTSIPTVSLTTEYLRPVKQGDWVESRTELTKRGRNLLFSRTTASVDGKAVFTSTGIFVPGPHDPGGLDALAPILADD